jgi:hypothetical protein
MGGSAHQTRKDSDLGKVPSGAGDPKDASLTTHVHKRQKRRTNTSYEDPSI